MTPEFEKSSIERLKQTLYSRDENVVPKEKHTPVPGREFDVPKNWGENTSLSFSMEDMKKKNNSFFNKFLLGAVLFFLASLGIAAFMFLGGMNLISSNNLDIKITAPSSVSSGEELSADLNIVNGNRTDLENVSLFVTYPEGAKSPNNQETTLSHEKIELGVIKKGGVLSHPLRVLLFGEKDAVKTFVFKLEYKVKGSNAIFSKEKNYDVLIGSSPIDLFVSFPKEVTSGQNVTLDIDITSNSSVVMKDTLLKIEYPYGFTYKSSNMKPIRQNSIWNIGDLKAGDKKTLSITGTLVGQNLEDRSFRISAGSKSQTSDKDFETTLSTTLVTLGIRKSFFDLSIRSADQAPNLGASSVVYVGWQNTLPDQTKNNQIEVVLSGNAFNRDSVSASGGGFYRSVDNTIVWDKSSTNDLGSISPGSEGEVTFSVSSFGDIAKIRQIKNPHIDIKATMTGDRVGLESGEVTSQENYTIKIAGLFTLSAKTYRGVGPFQNSGSIPPKADKETTYTVTWTLTNTSNDISNTSVTGVLPLGVMWKGEISPGSEKVSFNPDTKTVTWNIGTLSAGTGFTKSAKEVSFKVGITPSLSQVGEVPILVSNNTAKGFDTYIEENVVSSAGNVDTRFSDPNFVSGNELIIK